MWSPWMFKLPFGIFIDFEFFSRKTLLIVMGISAIFTHGLVALDVIDDIDHLVYCMMVLNFNSAVMDVLTKTILLRESRVDPENGFKDLQSYFSVAYGIGSFLGSVIAAITTQYYGGASSYLFASMLAIIITVLPCFYAETTVDDDVS
jgi:uncharacterized membrane protein